ncbi:MAG: hypothetical protein ACHQ6T_04585 [Myxococcota bacterium]
MTKITNSLLGTAVFLAFLVAAALGRADAAPDHAELDHVYVRITDAGLRPAAQTLAASQAIGFLNSSSQVVRISFDKTVVTRIKCRSATSFQLAGDRLASGRVQGSQFASLCSLAPGSYAYRVDLQQGAGTGPELVVRSFEGMLTVK